MMRSRLPLVVSIVSSLLAACSHDIGSQNIDRPDLVREHRLTFAANSDLGITEATLDEIIREMNTIVHHPDYAWDAPCGKVRFAKSGPLVARADLPLAGPFEHQVKQLRKLAPSANVLLVSSVGCGKVASAAGCANMGAEPSIMALNSRGYEALTVLHERGHNMGLAHSAESPTIDREVSEQVGMRYMFWRLGQGHLGQISRECEGFSKTLYPSITSPGGTDASDKLVVAAGPSSVTDLAESPMAPSRVQLETQQRQAARSAGLTPRAYGVIAPPLLEGELPLAEISALGKEDITSIRNLLRGTPNAYWLNACYVLAIAGGPEDVELIENTLTRPITPSATSSLQDRKPDQISKGGLIALKLGAADSLGMIANRVSRRNFQAAKSAVDTLFKVAHIDQASMILGQGQAALSLSRGAQRALSLPQTPESRAFVTRLLKSTETAGFRGIDSSGLEFAPLEQEDIADMNLNRLELQNRDLISYLKLKR